MKFITTACSVSTHISCDDVRRDDGPLVAEHLVGGGGGEVGWLGGQVGAPVAGPGQGGGGVAQQVEHKLEMWRRYSFPFFCLLCVTWSGLILQISV